MNKLYYSRCAWNYSSNPTLFFEIPDQLFSFFLPKFAKIIFKCVLEIFWPLKVLITISMKRQTPSFFFQRKWFAKLNQELLLFCHPLPLPPLACSLPPSFWVALSALENCGSSNLHHLLCNPIFKPLTMGFHTRTSQTGDQRQVTFEISSGK